MLPGGAAGNSALAFPRYLPGPELPRRQQLHGLTHQGRAAPGEDTAGDRGPVRTTWVTECRGLRRVQRAFTLQVLPDPPRGAAARRAPADPPGPVHRASQHHRGPPRSGRPAVGRRAGGAGRQRTVPRPADLTAAPARICTFMFPAALADRPANRNRSVPPSARIARRMHKYAAHRLAGTCSFAALRSGASVGGSHERFR